MRVSLHLRAPHGAMLPVLLSLSLSITASLTTASPSFAADASSPDSSASTSTLLPQARSAWDRGAWKRVEVLYKQTIDAGGLSPRESVEAYSRLGAAESLLKKRDPALVAFRHAALIDPHFAPPSVAGRKGAALVALAKKQEAKIGAIILHSEIPQAVSAGVPLDIAATLDADHAAIMAKIGIVASDASGTPVFSDSTAAATDVHFTIPAAALITGTNLAVRVDALDAHQNRMATVERSVMVGASVDGAGGLAGVGGVNGGAPGSSASRGSGHGAGANGSSVMFSDVKPIGSDNAKTSDSSKGGFWSTPWPYVIGGLALAAGGAAFYLETRPGDDVSVGAARINAR